MPSDYTDFPHDWHCHGPECDNTGDGLWMAYVAGGGQLGRFCEPCLSDMTANFEQTAIANHKRAQEKLHVK